jgi:hypothetical protein
MGPSPGRADFFLAPSLERGLTDAEFTVTVRNDTPALAAYTVTAYDERGALHCSLDTNHATLAAGTATSIPLKVRSRFRLIGEARSYPFTVESRVDGQDAARFLHGAFVQEPLFRTVRPLFAVAAALTILGGAVVTKALQPVEARVSSADIKTGVAQGDRVDTRAESTAIRIASQTAGGRSYLVHTRHAHRATKHP